MSLFQAKTGIISIFNTFHWDLVESFVQLNGVFGGNLFDPKTSNQLISSPKKKRQTK